MAMDFFLAGDGAIGRGEGCSGLERPLARFELERTREQKKPSTLQYSCVVVGP